MDQTAKRRRKRVGADCPNPLFLLWLEEWRDEAKENGWSSHHSYNKAVKSLKQYPLPLGSGQEAKILEGIGDKIANMLDKQLTKQSATDTGGASQPCSTASPRTGTCQSSQAIQAVSPLQGSGSQLGRTGRGGTAAKEPSKGKENKSQPAAGAEGGTPKSKRKKSSKEYVPAIRSGGYAVLVALRKSEEAAYFRGFMSKIELQAAAQQYCDVSFTTPSDPESYYTAWSSVSGLVKKGLVQKEGNPARYSLTYKGTELAERLLLVGSSGEAGSPPCTQGAHHGTHCSSQSGSSGTEVSPVSQHPPPPFAPCPPAKPAPPQSSVSGSNLPMYEHLTLSEAHPSQVASSTTTSDMWSSALPTKPLRHWYVDTDGRCVLEKDKAAVTFDSTILVGYLIKCLKRDLLQSRVKYILDRSRKSVGEEIYVYLADESATDVCTGLPVEGEGERKGGQRSTDRQECVDCSSSLGAATSTDELPDCSLRGHGSSSREITVLLSDDDSDGDMCEVPLMARLGVCPQQRQAASCPPNPTLAPHFNTDLSNTVQEKPLEEVVCLDVGSNCSSDEDSQTECVKGTSDGDTILAVVPSGGCFKLVDQSTVGASGGPSKLVAPSTVGASGGPSKLVGPSTVGASSSMTGGSLSSSGPLDPLLTEPSDSSPQEAPLFTLQPGHFQVVLLVDNQETTTKSMFRGVLLKELSRYGVKFQVRKLQVGDFLWVAQENVSHMPGQLSLPETREVVLEYIVERKRMDDLARSIVDKRFGEQKFRMSNCGLPYPIYLVEKFGDASHFSVPERSLKQAIANTQIINGFHIMETESIQESVAYFTFMTRYMQTMYMGKSLEAHSVDYFTTHHAGRSGVHVAGTGCVRLMTYSAFDEGSVKNKVLSITEMFAKQLLQVPGITPEKAAAIVERYSTPSALCHAYAVCALDKDKEQLLTSVKWGGSRRNIGAAISGRIYQLFGC